MRVAQLAQIRALLPTKIRKQSSKKFEKGLFKCRKMLYNVV